MAEYVVSTPKNPQYSGKAYGVVFRAGRAFVSPHTIDPSLGWSADEVAYKLHEDFGYVIEPVGQPEPTPVAAANKNSGKKRGKAAASKAAEAETAPEE